MYLIAYHIGSRFTYSNLSLIFVVLLQNLFDPLWIMETWILKCECAIVSCQYKKWLFIILAADTIFFIVQSPLSSLLLNSTVSRWSAMEAKAVQAFQFSAMMHSTKSEITGPNDSLRMFGGFKKQLFVSSTFHSPRPSTRLQRRTRSLVVACLHNNIPGCCGNYLWTTNAIFSFCL